MTMIVQNLGAKICCKKKKKRISKEARVAKIGFTTAIVRFDVVLLTSEAITFSLTFSMCGS